MARPEDRLRSRTGSGVDLDDQDDAQDRVDDQIRGDERGAQPDWLTPDDRPTTALSPYLPERWRSARLDPGRRGMVVMCTVGALVVLVAAYGMLRDSPTVAPVPTLPVVAPESTSTAASATTREAAPEALAEADIVVSVVGLVFTPGLVHLPPGSRVADALAAAGGVRDGADVLALNLAAKVSDGDQILVGATPPEPRPLVSGTVPAAPTTPGSGTAPTTDGSTGAVNLNEATLEELDSLAGVGPVTAANIVSWREVNGPFTDVAQLGEVDGIGPVRLEKLRSQVFV